MEAVFDGTVVRPPYAGVQLSVLEEMRALADALGDLSGCRFYSGDPDFSRAIQARGGSAPLVSGRLRRVALRLAWQQLVLPGLLRRSGAEVLHALAYTAPRRCPVPYVLNVHDIIALDRPDLCSRMNRLHMQALLPASVRRAALCIVSTHYVADRLQAVLDVPAARLAVVPLGVDAARFGTPAPRPALPGLPAERPYVLFVGNLEPKKGLGTLLDAYAIAACAGRFDLVVAGRAAWRCGALRERLLHWPGPGRVHWLGRVPGAALPGLMQHATVLVQPSLEEGFGMPVLEAMAAGTPVLHSDHPALMEAAGGAGLAFHRGGAADLAGRLDAFLGDAPWQADLAAAGRERAAVLPWRRWGTTAAALLRTVAGKAPP